MDNTNKLSESFMQPSEISAAPFGSSTSTNDTGFFDGLKNINFTTWLIIIFILAFLGFNIFAYLAKGTQTLADFSRPLLNTLFGTTVAVAGQTVDISAEGAKAVVGGTASVIQSGLTKIQEITPNPSTSQTTISTQPISTQKIDVLQDTTLNKALNSASTTQQQNQDYQAHEASSTVHAVGKSGWCFIGEDRGFRSCAQVGVNDECMSGDIFPSQEICMNPNLRA